jgi:dihydrolipoamide dehydrogenase
MTQQHIFDIAVIGGGPGGYVAAIKAAQLGKLVVLIEKNYLGGTCLNVGCIPTKTLIAGTQLYEKLKHADEYGIHTGPITFDYGFMKRRKDGVVDKIRTSLEGLVKTNGITVLSGHAEFLSPTEIKVKGHDNCVVKASKVIIATGSAPLDIPSLPCDHTQIYNSTSILEMTDLPKTLAIVGGGYIGCEFASLYAQLGVKVTILEAMPGIVYLQGKALSNALTEAFVKQEIDIKTGVFVEGLEKSKLGVTIKLKNQPSITCDRVLVSIGRKIVSDRLGLEKAGVLVNDKGVITVNDKMETNVPGIYAIGDVTGKYMLAHVASHQGLVAGANATGQSAKMHYQAVPAVIFTQPEIATVGMTLEQAVEAGFSATLGKFPFQALGKAVATKDTEGFAQVVVDQKTGQILGAQVVGHESASLIAEMALAIANELTLECLTDTIHAHPTLPEAWLEAGLIAAGTPIHFPPKIRR